MKESNSKKLDKQYDLLVTVDKKVAVIEEHLRTINGQVISLHNKCTEQDVKITGIEQKLWMAVGGGIVLMTLLKFVGVI